MKTKLFYSLLFLMFFSVAIPQQKVTTYKFNTVTLKYHYSNCRWAKKCTKNCVDLTLKEIKDKKGIPCKVCKPPKW